SATAPRRLEDAVPTNLQAELGAAQDVVRAERSCPGGFGDVLDDPRSAARLLELLARGEEVVVVVAAAAPLGDVGEVLARPGGMHQVVPLDLPGARDAVEVLQGVGLVEREGVVR